MGVRNAVYNFIYICKDLYINIKSYRKEHCKDTLEVE